jgi:hypothetical protein
VNGLVTNDIEDELRKGLNLNSPISYRPIAGGGVFAEEPEDLQRFRIDSPLLIDNDYCSETFVVEEPKQFADIFIEGCRQRTIYVCGAVPVAFVTHCKDSTIFIGAAAAVRVEFCANIRIIAAARTFHIESSIGCTAYLLVNNRPIVTGSCTRLLFAPYNAQYRKVGLDLLCIGINPRLNLWDRPVLVGSLGAPPERMPPEQFQLLCLPFTWQDMEPLINAIVPSEYAVALEGKRNQIANLKRYLDIIQEKDQALYDALQGQIKVRSYAWLEERGCVAEVKWAAGLPQPELDE